MADPSSRTDLRGLLEKVEAASPIEAVEVVADELAVMVGARTVRFLIADLSGRAVVRFGELAPGVAAVELEGVEDAVSVKLTGTVYERVLRTQRVDVRQTGNGALLTVPVTDRGEALGLLELTLPQVPDEQVVADVAAAAHALAYVVVANRRHTDLFEWGQRTTHFTLAAEIQRRLLPSTYTCEAGQFTVAGWLEPASSVGGDTFDYSFDRDALQVSITDAAGHEVAAALLATLLVGSLRNERRRGADLGEQAREANNALAAHSTVGQFVTGQLLRVDLHTGDALIVNAGHPFPLRLRHGRVEEIELDIDLPFGLEPGRSFRLQQFPLQTGDRVVFVTDGMLERNAERLDVAETLGRSRNMHPRELVHALGAAVLRATGGDLRDDATIVCLDWHGGSAREGPTCCTVRDSRAVSPLGRSGRRADGQQWAEVEADEALIARAGGVLDLERAQVAVMSCEMVASVGVLRLSTSAREPCAGLLGLLRGVLPGRDDLRQVAPLAEDRVDARVHLHAQRAARGSCARIHLLRHIAVSGCASPCGGLASPTSSRARAAGVDPNDRVCDHRNGINLWTPSCGSITSRPRSRRAPAGRLRGRRRSLSSRGVLRSGRTRGSVGRRRVWVEGGPAGYVLDVTDTTGPPPGAVPDPVEDALELAVHYPTPESAVLQVDGELDALTCVRFGQRALALLVDRPDLIIDLSQVRFMGSSALKVLIDAHDAARARQGQLHVVTGDQATVVRPITRTALNRLLRLHPDLDAALAALSLPG